MLSVMELDNLSVLELMERSPSEVDWEMYNSPYYAHDVLVNVRRSVLNCQDILYELGDWKHIPVLEEWWRHLRANIAKLRWRIQGIELGE